MRGSREDGLLADAFFQTLFQSSPDAALVTRMRDGAILHVNDEFCHITWFTREEAIGKTATELKLYLNPDDLALLWVKRPAADYWKLSLLICAGGMEASIRRLCPRVYFGPAVMSMCTAVSGM